MITPKTYTAVVGTVGRQVRITATDHNWEKTLAALAQLKEARRTRQNYDDLLQAAIASKASIQTKCNHYTQPNTS